MLVYLTINLAFILRASRAMPCEHQFVLVAPCEIRISLFVSNPGQDYKNICWIRDYVFWTHWDFMIIWDYNFFLINQNLIYKKEINHWIFAIFHNAKKYFF